MLILNSRMYEASKFGMGGGAPKAPGQPPPPPTPGGAATQVKDRNPAAKKYGRQQTILGGTMGGTSPNSDAKTLLGG